MNGLLILVVGPSGVGKDTLLAGAQSALADDPGFVFARRDITRPADAGGEDHRPVSRDAFDRIAAAGGYLLHWAAHGLCYGLPAALQDRRRAGVHVVANGSRATLALARAELAPVRVVAITAPAAALRERLQARGRESAAEIEERVARAVAWPVADADTTVINDGAVADGVAALVAALRAAPASRSG